MREGDRVELGDMPGIVLSISHEDFSLWFLSIEGLTKCRREDVDYAS
jgi:hypothetical protein